MNQRKTATRKTPSFPPMADDWVMISVIIPSYNSEITIIGCLNALQNQSYGGCYDITLIDSSDDGTPEIVSLEYPNVKLIHLNDRTDPGTARNIGIAEAKGDLIAFWILIVCPTTTGWRELQAPTIRLMAPSAVL